MVERNKIQNVDEIGTLVDILASAIGTHLLIQPKYQIPLKVKEELMIRLDNLRHSYASLLVELGFQPLAIAERLGHEKIETTLNTYSHLYPNKQAELAYRLELENEEDAQILWMLGGAKYLW